MKRALIAVLVAIASFAAATVEPVHGVFHVTFGHIRTADGRMIQVRGWDIPYTATPINATYVPRGFPFPKSILPKPLAPLGSPLSPQGSTTVYQNDNGSSSYFYTDPGASCLDDLTLASTGNGQTWASMDNGMYIDTTTPFLIRWIGFNSYVSGRGEGVSAFTDTLFDFGGVFDPSTLNIPNAFKVHFNLAQYPIASTPDGVVYLAQQFRDTSDLVNGNGAFLSGLVTTVFSGGGASVGSSEDQFWYDAEPNGIYDETEVDNFGGPPNEANFLFIITTAGSTTTLSPSSYTWAHGTADAGDLGSLWYVDKDYLTAYCNVVNGDAPQLVVDSVAPGTYLTAMRLDLVTHTDSPNIGQVVELYNFTQSKWVQFSSSAATIADTTATVFVTSNPSQYVSTANKHVRARITWARTAKPVRINWHAAVDEIDWVVTRP